MPRREDESDQVEELTPRQKATKAFFRMIRECGAEIVRMPASCETYVSRYLFQYPDDAKLLNAVVRANIPQELLAHEAKRGYTEFLNSHIAEFAKNEKVSKPDAKWAVETWAEAIGRPRGYVFEAPDIDPADFYPDPERDKRYDMFVKAAMIFIVGIGGFFGTFVAVSLLPILAWAYGATPEAMDLRLDNGERLETWAYFLTVFVMAAGCGVVGAAAGIMGWVFGGGDVKPWSTASVASGSAFMGVYVILFLSLFCCVPLIFAPFIHFGMVFSTAYKSAARGGNY